MQGKRQKTSNTLRNSGPCPDLRGSCIKALTVVLAVFVLRRQDLFTSLLALPVCLPVKCGASQSHPSNYPMLCNSASEPKISLPVFLPVKRGACHSHPSNYPMLSTSASEPKNLASGPEARFRARTHYCVNTNTSSSRSLRMCVHPAGFSSCRTWFLSILPNHLPFVTQ